MGDFVLKNGLVVLNEGIKKQDIVIVGDQIHELVDGFQKPSGKVSGEVIDCSDTYILPGAIDVHVHFRTPGEEYKEDWDTGSKAALAGGVTTVFDMPNNEPVIDCEETLQMKQGLIEENSRVNYGLYIGATGSEHNLTVLKKVQGVCGIKMYMGSSTGDLLLDDKTKIEEIFKQIEGKIFCVHAETQALLEDPDSVTNPALHSKLRPPEAALDAVKFVLDMSEKYKRRVHICHLTTKEEVELLSKRKTSLVSCEVTPHHLFLDDSVYERLGNFAKVNPPLRTTVDREALWEGLRNGVIDMVATDHAPHTVEEKKRPYHEAPAGMSGVETMMPLLLNEVSAGRLSLLDLVRITSFNPARLFGLPDRGEIAAGKKADLVIFDLNLVKTVRNGHLFTKCGWSAFDGWELFGWPVLTMVNGEIAYRDGVFSSVRHGKDIFIS